MTTTVVMDPKTGDVLPNGGRVLLAKRVNEGPTVDTFIVLCLWGDQFVTWTYFVDKVTPEKNECFWGHYHSEDLAYALADYGRRS